MGTNPKETETNVSNRLLPSSVHCSTISSHYGKETIQLSVDTGDKCLKVGTLILFSHKLQNSKKKLQNSATYNNTDIPEIIMRSKIIQPHEFTRMLRLTKVDFMK